MEGKTGTYNYKSKMNNTFENQIMVHVGTSLSAGFYYHE